MEPTRGWRQRALVAGLAAVSLCLVACGGDNGPSEGARSAAPYDVQTRHVTGPGTRDVVVWAPVEQGNWPVVYAVPGVSGRSDDLDRLGPALAEQGVVVFSTDYRVGGSLYDVARDVMCGYRLVATEASRYGGDLRKPVTAVGYSAGATYVGIVASSGAPKGLFAPCPGAAPSPDVMVGINGCYFRYQGHPVTFDPANLGRLHARIVLVTGEEDRTCPSWQSMKGRRVLEEAGFDVTLVTLPGANHYTPVFHDVVDGRWVTVSDSAAGKATVRAILHAIDASS